MTGLADIPGILSEICHDHGVHDRSWFRTTR
jgi:hypothetical protein